MVLPVDGHVTAYNNVMYAVVMFWVVTSKILAIFANLNMPFLSLLVCSMLRTIYIFL